nr:unnamed protein product [Spirometra erinaceieuropaei]
MNSDQTERVDWVELLDPESKKVIFANLESGEVLWEAPSNAKVKPLSDNQWWELRLLHVAAAAAAVSSASFLLITTRVLFIQDIGMMHRQKSSRSDGWTSRNSLLMGEPKQAAGWQSASRPLPRQTPQSAVPATSAQPPPPPPPPHQQQRSPKDFEVHRRRNSQPSRSSGQQQQHHHHHHHSLTRNSLSGRSCPAPSSLGVANQRVTEWLRTAGALPEEAEFESLDMSAAAVADATGDPSACPRSQNVPDMARWSRNSGLSAGPATAAPHYPTVTHSSAFALQSPSSSGPPTGGAVTYDRRMRPAVPVHAAPKGQTVRLPEAPDLRDNFSFSGGGDAFSNLLYDTGCNVVYPRPPETQLDPLAAAAAAFGSAGTEQVEQAFSGLNFGRSPAVPACHRTPQPITRNRNIPRTNPAFVGSSGQTSNFTMPRLSAGAAVTGGGAWAAGNNRLSQQAPVGSHLPTFAEFGNAAPLQRTDQLNGLHKSARDKGFSNGFQADATPSSPDTELTNESASETDSDQEMGDFGGAVLRDQQNELLCASRDDDLFESHARFSPVVDEYTFTVDRTADLVGVGGPSEPPPPVPPPRTASAEASVRSAPPPHSPIGAPSANRQSSLADESTTWQSFASPTMGFLPRGHPFRQPTFRSTRQPGSADEEPILQDEPGHSGSSRTQSTVSQDAITTSASVVSTGLQPRRSASGGFIGPTEECSMPTTSASSGAPTSSSLTKPESGVVLSSASSSSATHFALISGPFSWPKELFRPGQDYTTLMFWTKSTFTKRLLSATDKNLQKIANSNLDPKPDVNLSPHLYLSSKGSYGPNSILSTDLDTFTTVRFQLEKLFEVFRMVHVIPRDTSDRSSTLSSQSSTESPAAAVGHYTILRPPPAGWSRSQLAFAPEGVLQQQEEAEGGEEAGRQPTHPLLLPCSKLTGSFSLPLRPTPIPDRPSEYMLLTPRAAWPADLAGFIHANAPPDSSSCPLDPHLAAGLLKLWIRELATPLIPLSLMAEVLAAATEAEAFELRAGAPNSPAVRNNAGSGRQPDGMSPIQACCALVRRLPPLSRRCLLYLIKLLQFLARPENSGVSLMDARNLATVIAPNLFRSSSTNASELLNSVQSQTAFVRLLITYLDIDAEADLLNAEPDADPVRNRFRSPPRARINADGILIPFR